MRLILLSFSLSAQEAEVGLVGRISGLVVDRESGTPLIGATVTAVGQAPVSATTDLDGRYRLSGIPVGNVSVKFERNGYQVV